MLPILLHELKYYFKNAHEVIYIYGFYVTILLILPLGMRQQLHVLPELAPAIVLMGLIASIAIGSMGLFQRDAEQGVLEQYQLMPSSLGAAVVAKWLAFYMATVVPLAAIAPAIMLLFRLPVFVWPGYVFGALAAGADISLVATIAAAISVGLDRARAVVLLMIFPLTVPVVIFGSHYLQSPGHWWQPSMLFMLAFGMFLLPVLSFAGAGCIRASH